MGGVSTTDVYSKGVDDWLLPFLDAFAFWIEVVQKMTWSNLTDSRVAL